MLKKKANYKNYRSTLMNLAGISAIKGLWKLLIGYRTTFFTSIISMGGMVASVTAGLFVIRLFINKVIVDKMWSLIPVFVLSFIGAAMLRALFSFISGKTSAKTSESITRDIRNNLYDHIQRQAFAYHDKTQTGELIQRSTSDVDAIRKFYTEQIMGISRISFLFLINFFSIFWIHKQLALYSIMAVPLIVILSRYFFKIISKNYKIYQQQGDKLSSVLQENLSGIRIVKAFARQEFEKKKFDRVNREYYKRGKKLITTHSLYWPISHIICGLQMIAGYWIAGNMAYNNIISIGDFVAFSSMINFIIWPMQQLGRLISQLSISVVSYNRIIEIIKNDQEDLNVGIEDPKKKLRGEVVFKNVSFAYKKGIPVLKDISFSSKRGDKIALLGGPGSGKTSLVNLLPRFYDYQKGEVLLDGRPLNRYSRHFLRKNIGIVQQEPFLFSTSIKENLIYGIGKEINMEKIIKAAKMASIHDSISNFSNKYKTIVGEKGVTLSGGQKQRIAIARTILKDPGILILDDSTSSVDPITEQKIKKALDKIMKSCTTFIIAHRIQTLMSADLILVFKNGKIIQRGTHKELIKKSGFYGNVFQKQTKIEFELKKAVKNV